MKSRYFLFTVIAACMVLWAFVMPAKLLVPNEVTSIHRTWDTHDKYQTIVCEPIIYFTETIEPTQHDNAKTHETLHKLLVKENLKIESSVENYIFFIEALAYYHSDLSELKRLNI